MARIASPQAMHSMTSTKTKTMSSRNPMRGLARIGGCHRMDCKAAPVGAGPTSTARTMIGNPRLRMRICRASRALSESRGVSSAMARAALLNPAKPGRRGKGRARGVAVARPARVRRAALGCQVCPAVRAAARRPVEMGSKRRAPGRNRVPASAAVPDRPTARVRAAIAAPPDRPVPGAAAGRRVESRGFTAAGRVRCFDSRMNGRI